MGGQEEGIVREERPGRGDGEGEREGKGVRWALEQLLSHPRVAPHKTLSTNDPLLCVATRYYTEGEKSKYGLPDLTLTGCLGTKENIKKYLQLLVAIPETVPCC